MNDDPSLPDLDPSDPDLLAASAVFDGVADDAERARVDASPVLGEMVVGFAAIRAALRDVPPAPAVELDDAVAAALAEFDVLANAPAVAAAATVPAAARARWSRVLAVAAAAVLLGVVGVAVAKGVGGSSRSSSSSARTTGLQSATTPAGGTVAAAADSDGSPGAFGVTSTIGVIDVAADALPAYDQPNDLRTLPGTVDSTVGGATADSAPVAPAASPGKGVQQPLIGAMPFPFTCPLTAQQVFIAEISWKGTPAAAVRDTVTGITQAIDPQCKVLVSVEP